MLRGGLLSVLVMAHVAMVNVPLAMAAVRTDIPQVGPHEPIFVFEKNENPQNIMVVYTEVDKNCHFIDTEQKPLIGYYWLMDGKNYKPVHSMIKSSMQQRLQVEKRAADGFIVRVNDLKELKTDLKDFRVQVKALRTGGQGCDVQAFVTLGPSDHDRVLKLQTIASESEKTIVPPFRKLDAITLVGKDVATGEMVKRKYQGRM